MMDFHDFGEADYAGKPLEMIRTRANLKIQSGLQYAQSMNRPVYFIGPAGVGKTVALREAVNQIECAYYCSTTEATKGYSGMLSMIHVAIRGTLPNEKSNFLLAERVKQLLKHGNTWSETLGDWQPVKKLLIIDEVQTMETRLVFELLKMQEDCRFNLILCGNGQSLAARKKDRETIKQITTRTLQIDIQGPSEDDIRQIAGSYGVTGLDAYAACVAFGLSHNNLRELVNILDFAKDLSPSGQGINAPKLGAAFLRHGLDAPHIKKLFQLTETPPTNQLRKA